MPMSQPKIAANPAAERPSTAAPATPAVPMGGVAAIAQPTGIADSPARQLHDLLVETFNTPTREIDDRWSGPARLGFIVGASLLLWSAIGASVVALLF